MKTTEQWQALSQSLTWYTQAYIDGQFQPAVCGETIPCINPSTEQLIADVTSCDETEANLAVSNARTVFDSGIWSQKTPTERKKVLLKLAALLEQHQDEFALMDTLNMGKPITEMVSIDVPHAIDCLQWAAEYIDKMYGDVAPTGQDVLAMTQYEPMGVIACIVPWNYPLMIAIWKLAPALAAGNSVILKPSEKTPFSALYLAKLATQAGLPDGVLNVLPGYGETVGKALALHSDVDAISFTGSTQTAAKLMQYAGQSNLKKVWNEAGGNTPNIIFSDCENIKQAATVAAMAAFSNQGEVCIAGARLYIEKSIKAEFISALLTASQSYQPSDPLSAETRMGPMVDKAQWQRLHHYIQSAIEEGGKLIYGGVTDYQQGQGFFAQPTIIDEATNAMRCIQEEVFGPLLTICEFETEEEAIQLANDSKYGLGAAVWTSKLSRAHRVSRQIKAGNVWVNTWGEGAPSIPFGGIKASGNGRDKSYQAIEKYMEVKTVFIRV